MRLGNENFASGLSPVTKSLFCGVFELLKQIPKANIQQMVVVNSKELNSYPLRNAIAMKMAYWRRWEFFRAYFDPFSDFGYI